MTPKLALPLALILVTWLFAACATPPPEAPPEPAVDLAAMEQEIRDLSAQWMAAAQARNLAGVMDMFTADATLNFDGTIQQGLDEIRAAEQANWAALPDSTMEWTAGVVVVAAAGDMAHERGTWIFDPDGPGEAAGIAGDYVSVWQKIDGDWKVVIDAGSARKVAREDEATE